MTTRTEAETRSKAKAFDDKVAANARAHGRKSMLKILGKTEADLGPKRTEAQIEADHLAALPRSIAEAKGDTRAFARANMERLAAAERGVKPANAGSASMMAELKRQGIGPRH